ncbi:MAG: hypothetical protein ACRCVU_13960 [Flavobacterium sp.]
MDCIISFIIKDTDEQESTEFLETAICAVLGIGRKSSYPLDVTGRALQYHGFAENIDIENIDTKLIFPIGVKRGLPSDD